MKNLLLIAASTTLLIACDSHNSPDAAPRQVDVSVEKVSWIAFGDTGTGTEDQTVSGLHLQPQVAELAHQVCEIRGCDVVTIAGDNVYDKGVRSTDDVLFEQAFETPYEKFDIPFIMALGNHDTAASDLGDGARNSFGDLQVQYSRECENITGCSGKWTMPSRYYSYTVPQPPEENTVVAEPLVEFFVLDSTAMAPFLVDGTGWYDDNGGGVAEYANIHRDATNAMLSSSRAKWKVALAHHPYLSNGDHGNAGNYERNAPFEDNPGGQDGCQLFTNAAQIIAACDANPAGCPFPAIDQVPTSQAEPDEPTCRGEHYKPMLDNSICANGGIDLFLQGHDHELQWLAPVDGHTYEDTDYSCGTTQFILSGASAKSRTLRDKTRNEALVQIDDTLGFFWISVNNAEMTVALYTLDIENYNQLAANGDYPDADTAAKDLSTVKASRVDADGKPLPIFERTVIKGFTGDAR